MAYKIPISQINPAQRALIQKLLVFKPTPGFNDDYEELPEPIHFYSIEKDCLLLPFMFAASMFQIVPNVNNNFKKIDIKFTAELRPYQIPVYEESCQQMDEKSACTLSLYASFGKTILGAALSVRNGLLTCVLMTLKKLTTQWKDTFEKYTTARVWIVDDKKPPPAGTYDVIICMKDRWSKIPADIRLQVGTLIIDEAHLFCTRCSVSCLLAFQPTYIIAETATLERDDDLHQMIYAVCGDHGIYKECDKKFFVTKLLTNTQVERKLNRKRKTDYTKLIHDTIMNTRRNDIIFNIVKFHPEYKILILTNLVDHVMLLYNHLKLTEDVDYLCGSKEEYKDSRILVGTTHKIGTGFDQASNKLYGGVRFNLLILVFSIKKYQMLVQNVGRVLRADVPHIIHFSDSDGIFKSHWAKCQKWYKKRDAVIDIVDVQSDVIDMDKNIFGPVN